MEKNLLISIASEALPIFLISLVVELLIFQINLSKWSMSDNASWESLNVIPYFHMETWIIIVIILQALAEIAAASIQNQER